MIVVYTGADAGTAPCLAAEVREALSVITSHDELSYHFPYDLLNVEEEDYRWFHDFIDHDYNIEQPVSHSIVLEILPGRDCPLEPG